MSDAPAGAQRSALARNPRAVRYWRQRTSIAASQLRLANEAAIRSRGVVRLAVPRHVFDWANDVCDDPRALAGALEWVRGRYGAGVVLEIEAAALYRVAGSTQLDDWSCARARRKAGLLIFFCMAPHTLPRNAVTGSTSTEPMQVTCGVSENLLVKIFRSSQREPYCKRTLQRDMAEIDECTHLLLRWRTPACKAQPWECGPNGVVNRYCVRAAMIRERWRRSSSSAQALVKATVVQFASWLVWRPAPARGSDVPDLNAPAPAPA